MTSTGNDRKAMKFYTILFGAVSVGLAAASREGVFSICYDDSERRKGKIDDYCNGELLAFYGSIAVLVLSVILTFLLPTFVSIVSSDPSLLNAIEMVVSLTAAIFLIVAGSLYAKNTNKIFHEFRDVSESSGLSYYLTRIFTSVFLLGDALLFLSLCGQRFKDMKAVKSIRR